MSSSESFAEEITKWFPSMALKMADSEVNLVSDNFIEFLFDK